MLMNVFYMTGSPVVSVIIPTYNAQPYLEQCLESILQQTYKNIEILICDDCSSDQTAALLEKFSDERMILFKNQTNQGYLRSINFLVSKATGDFICFQDADDFSHPDRIQIQLQALLSQPELGLIGSNYAIIDSSGEIVRESTVETNVDVLHQLLQIGNPFQKPSILFRRDVYDKVGMYREEFLKLGNISEDFDWILRVSERYKVGNVNYRDPLYFYRSLPTSMSKNIKCVDQLLGHQVAIRLYKERQYGQKDSIEKGDLESIRDYIREMRRPYQQNKALFHEKLAASFMYAGMNQEAIRHSMMAIVKAPLDWKNYRLLQYCLRKTIFRF